MFVLPGLIWGSPLLAPGTIARLPWAASKHAGRATPAGALGRAALLLFLSVAAAAVLWWFWYPAAAVNDQEALKPVAQASLVAGVLALSLVFLARSRLAWLPVVAPLYAILAGAFLGGVSLAAEARFPAIALNTVALTVLVFVVTAAGYRLGLLRPTERLRAVVFSTTAAIALVYLAAFGLSFAGLRIPFIHEGGWGGVIWTGFIALIATLHLLVDLAAVDDLARRQRPHYMEWYVALGLAVTLVWLYLFLLRLLSHLRR